MPKRLAALFCSLILAVVGAVVFATPAHAASVTVCLTPQADGPIRAYNNTTFDELILIPDGVHTMCGSIDDTGGNARVDVDPEISPWADIDSWQKRPANGTYSPCQVGEQSASNPYPAGPQNPTYYRNSVGSNCQGF